MTIKGLFLILCICIVSVTAWRPVREATGGVLYHCSWMSVCVTDNIKQSITSIWRGTLWPHCDSIHTGAGGGCSWLTVPPSHCPLWTLYQHSRKPDGGRQWLSGVAAHSGSPGPSPADCLFCPANTLSVELTAKGLETRTGRRSIQGASKSNTSFGGTEKKQKNNRGEWNQTGRDWKVGAFTAESSEVRRMEKALKKSCRCRWEISCYHPLSKCMGGGVCVTRCFLLAFFTTGGQARVLPYSHAFLPTEKQWEARKRESSVKLRPTRLFYLSVAT